LISSWILTFGSIASQESWTLHHSFDTIT
jgi:hypothetical protein